ncbi:TIGR00266 family protein [Otoolea muris]|uniref:TIGR00266 family protein n=1 Tax=Otoolea muris TaxID=2941515 RepID=UPI002040A55B|nr:TIGR00266 family protein [Otoolea muris]
MQYRIIGETMPAVEVQFDAPGESMFTQSGGMAWMTDGIEMSTNTKGGLMKGLGRMFAGESLFMATYRASRAGAQIAFASTVAGRILPVDVGARGGLICQKGAFLCGQDSVQLNVTFTKKLSSGLFGGEGFILQDISGSGMVFLEIDGDMVEKNLAPGEILKVDTGNVVAFERSVEYGIETVKGLGNIFFGGEGLFLTTLKGPGKVYLQTQNIAEFAGRIARFIPTSGK